MKHTVLRHWPALVLLPLLSAPAVAMTFDFGEGDDAVSINWDNSLTLGGQWRTQSPDRHMLRGDGTLVGGIIAANLDDGDRNFAKGHPVSERLTLLSEVDVKWRDFGFFARGKAFYDDVYASQRTDMTAAGFATYNSGTAVGGSTPYGEFPKHTREDYGSDVILLDAFAYGSFDIADHPLSVRLGRQVINWGESTFYPGIMALQNPVDVAASSTPGVEVKEILLPTGALYGQVNLTGHASMEAYYQYEWQPSRLDAVGSYFSVTDQIGAGAENYLALVGSSVFAFPRGADDRPSQNGQWGLAWRYQFDNGTEVAFYDMNAHSKTPSFVVNGIPIGGGLILPVYYDIRYFDNIRLYGLSFSTVIGETNIAGELSYRPNMPVVSADLIGSPVRDGQYQAMLNGTHIFGPSFIADQTTVVFELVHVQHDGRNDDQLRFNATALGAAVRTEFAWKNALPGIDLAVPVFCSWGINGTIKEMNLTEGAKAVSIGLNMLYLQKLEAGISVTNYFGGGINNWINDRDNVAMTLKYTF